MLTLFVTALGRDEKAENELAGKTETEERGKLQRREEPEMQKLVFCSGRWSISLCAHVYVKAGTE